MVCDECVYDLSRKDRFRPLTNADRIRNMTDEELADFLATYVQCEGCWLADTCASDLSRNCYDSLLKWLRSTVEESEE